MVQRRRSDSLEPNSFEVPPNSFPIPNTPNFTSARFVQRYSDVKETVGIYPENPKWAIFCPHKIEEMESLDFL